jgi:hypothetical protein
MELLAVENIKMMVRAPIMKMKKITLTAVPPEFEPLEL